VPLVTIDGEDARDFDDAVYCEPVGPGRRKWRLLVAIADVDHYVRSGDALDAEASGVRRRCISRGALIPMLPEKLSTDCVRSTPRSTAW